MSQLTPIFRPFGVELTRIDMRVALDWLTPKQKREYANTFSELARSDKVNRWLRERYGHDEPDTERLDGLSLIGESSMDC